MTDYVAAPSPDFQKLDTAPGVCLAAARVDVLGEKGARATYESRHHTTLTLTSHIPASQKFAIPISAPPLPPIAKSTCAASDERLPLDRLVERSSFFSSFSCSGAFKFPLVPTRFKAFAIVTLLYRMMNQYTRFECRIWLRRWSARARLVL